jgi:hypothetical protein
MSALIRQYPKPKFRKICVDALRSIWAMTAFTASRAPETTADNNDFRGEGAQTLSTSRLRGTPSVRWISSKHKRISPKRTGRGRRKDRAGAQRPSSMIDDDRSISSERRTTILEPHNLEGLYQSERNQGIAYVGVGAILKIRQGRLSKVVVEKFEGRKARRKEGGRIRLCG